MANLELAPADETQEDDLAQQVLTLVNESKVDSAQQTIAPVNEEPIAVSRVHENGQVASATTLEQAIKLGCTGLSQLVQQDPEAGDAAWRSLQRSAARRQAKQAAEQAKSAAQPAAAKNTSPQANNRKAEASPLVPEPAHSSANERLQAQRLHFIETSTLDTQPSVDLLPKKAAAPAGKSAPAPATRVVLPKINVSPKPKTTAPKPPEFIPKNRPKSVAGAAVDVLPTINSQSNERRKLIGRAAHKQHSKLPVTPPSTVVEMLATTLVDAADNPLQHVQTQPGQPAAELKHNVLSLPDMPAQMPPVNAEFTAFTQPEVSNFTEQLFTSPEAALITEISSNFTITNGLETTEKLASTSNVLPLKVFNEALSEIINGLETAQLDTTELNDEALPEVIDKIVSLLENVDLPVNKEQLRRHLETHGGQSLQKVLLAAYQMRDHAFRMEYNLTTQMFTAAISLGQRFAQLLLSLMSPRRWTPSNY